MSSDKVPRRSTKQIRELLKMYADQGRPIESLVPLLGREAATLKKHARMIGLEFSDYRPRVVEFSTPARYVATATDGAHWFDVTAEFGPTADAP